MDTDEHERNPKAEGRNPKAKIEQEKIEVTEKAEIRERKIV